MGIPNTVVHGAASAGADPEAAPLIAGPPSVQQGRAPLELHSEQLLTQVHEALNACMASIAMARAEIYLGKCGSTWCFAPGLPYARLGSWRLPEVKLMEVGFPRRANPVAQRREQRPLLSCQQPMREPGSREALRGGLDGMQPVVLRRSSRDSEAGDFLVYNPPHHD
jgi:hypothetical protein